MTEPIEDEEERRPAVEEPPQPARRFTPTEGADMLAVYFMRRRDVLIAELREIDRLLGRPQTVPPARER